MEPPPPPPSREEAPAQAEKRPLDAADEADVAAKKQRLADPSSPIDPKDVEGLKDNDRQEAIAAREAEAKAKIQAEAERRERERAEQAAAAEAARIQKQKEEAAARLKAEQEAAAAKAEAARIQQEKEEAAAQAALAKAEAEPSRLQRIRGGVAAYWEEGVTGFVGRKLRGFRDSAYDLAQVELRRTTLAGALGVDPKTEHVFDWRLFKKA